jgi:hypothetical protein
VLTAVCRLAAARAREGWLVTFVCSPPCAGAPLHVGSSMSCVRACGCSTVRVRLLLQRCPFYTWLICGYVFAVLTPLCTRSLCSSLCSSLLLRASLCTPVHRCYASAHVPARWLVSHRLVSRWLSKRETARCCIPARRHTSLFRTCVGVVLTPLLARSRVDHARCCAPARRRCASDVPPALQVIVFFFSIHLEVTPPPTSGAPGPATWTPGGARRRLGRTLYRHAGVRAARAGPRPLREASGRSADSEATQGLLGRTRPAGGAPSGAQRVHLRESVSAGTATPAGRARADAEEQIHGPRSRTLQALHNVLTAGSRAAVAATGSATLSPPRQQSGRSEDVINDERRRREEISNTLAPETAQPLTGRVSAHMPQMHSACCLRCC